MRSRESWILVLGIICSRLLLEWFFWGGGCLVGWRVLLGIWLFLGCLSLLGGSGGCGVVWVFCQLSFVFLLLVGLFFLPAAAGIV